MCVMCDRGPRDELAYEMTIEDSISMYADNITCNLLVMHRQFISLLGKVGAISG